MKIINIQWPIIFVLTITLYILIVLSLPFSRNLPLIFLFAVIGIWSRLPGVGIHHPFYILYQADVIDIFMLIISIHISPFHAILFVWFCNISSRSAGVFPGWPGTFHDCIIMTVLALLAPLFYSISSQNILVVVAIYSVLRIVGFIIMGFIWPIRSISQLFIEEIGAGFAIFIINMFYAKMFGSFFENLLIKGAVFNWPLFLLVTIIVLGIFIIVYGFSPKRAVKKAGKITKNIAHKFELINTTQNNKGLIEDNEEIRFIRDSIG